MKKVFDCFLFFNELELLELRLETLWDVVDYFVLVEANQTFSGNPKNLIFEENRERFNKYLRKIIYVKVEDSPKPINRFYYWNVEFFQRNCILRGLDSKAKNGDFIIISDVDEILSPNSIISSLNKGRKSFELELYYYYINLKQNRNWIGPVMYNYGDVGTPEKFRNSRFKFEVVNNGGWHFSYLGGTKKIIEKLLSFSEVSVLNDLVINEEFVNYIINNRLDLFGRKNLKYEIITNFEHFPPYIINFIKKYPYLKYESSINPLPTDNKFSLNIPITLRAKSKFRNIFIRLIQKLFDIYFHRVFF